MVPRLSINSCRSMPMPLSITASVPAFLSGTMRILGRLAVGDQIGRRDRLVAQLVEGVRGVRNQFAQEDVGLRINGVHHQVQQLGNLGLKWFVLGNGIRRHDRARSSRRGMPDITTRLWLARFKARARLPDRAEERPRLLRPPAARFRAPSGARRSRSRRLVIRLPQSSPANCSAISAGSPRTSPADRARSMISPQRGAAGLDAERVQRLCHLGRAHRLGNREPKHANDGRDRRSRATAGSRRPRACGRAFRGRAARAGRPAAAAGSARARMQAASISCLLPNSA